MALSVISLQRNFRFKKNGKFVSLEDPDSRLTPEEVLQHYSTAHPELTTSTIDGPTVVGDAMQYEFKTTVGTKG